MSTKHLRGQRAVTCGKGAIEFKPSVGTFPLDAVHVDLVSSDGEVLADHVYRDGDVFRVRPWSGGALLAIRAEGNFPSQTRISGVLQIQTASGMVNQIILEATDVSALPSVELVQFADVGERGWAISAVSPPVIKDPGRSNKSPIQPPAERQPAARSVDASAGAQEAVPDVVALPEPLRARAARVVDPAGDTARDAARRRIGRTRAAEADRRDIHVVLDLSASMLPHHRSGALQGLLSVLAGINDVHGQSEEFTLWPAMPVQRLAPRRLTRADAAVVADDLVSTVGVGSSSGVAEAFRAARAERAWRVVVSDGVPPDLLGELSAPGAGEQAPHLLAFAESKHDCEGGYLPPWRDQLGAADEAGRQHALGITSVRPAVAAAAFASGDFSALVGLLVESLVSELSSEGASS